MNKDGLNPMTRNEVTDTIVTRLIGENSYYPLPDDLQCWQTQSQVCDVMLSLAKNFESYFQQLSIANPDLIDRMNIPVELSPCYQAVNIDYQPGSSIAMQMCFPHEDVHYHTKRIGEISYTAMYLSFQWELLNRFLDPIPLGKLAAKSIVELKVATPKRIKQLIKWHQNTEDRLTGYRFTSCRGYRIKPYNSGMEQLDGMSKIIPSLEFMTFANSWRNIIELVESTTSTKIKLLLASPPKTTSGERRIRQLYFHQQLQLGKFIKLLPGCTEEDSKFVEL